MIKDDIEKHLKVHKWHHFLIYFPAGGLCMDGLILGHPEIWIGALLVFVGGLLQERFFRRLLLKMLEFLRQDLNRTV